jgi:peptide-methionine (R)-S-oxide reductase
MFFKTKPSEADFPIQRSEAEWRAALDPLAYRVLREHATERAGTSALNAEKRAGMFHCKGCGTALFESDTKFESGTGWPSFTSPVGGHVGEQEDNSFFMRRTEVHCAACGGHLGHVFQDGPEPTGLRYCINGAALEFRPATGA